jgi:hypothetical protein
LFSPDVCCLANSPCRLISDDPADRAPLSELLLPLLHELAKESDPEPFMRSRGIHELPPTAPPAAAAAVGDAQQQQQQQQQQDEVPLPLWLLYVPPAPELGFNFDVGGEIADEDADVAEGDGVIVIDDDKEELEEVLDESAEEEDLQQQQQQQQQGQYPPPPPPPEEQQQQQCSADAAEPAEEDMILSFEEAPSYQQQQQQQQVASEALTALAQVALQAAAAATAGGPAGAQQLQQQQQQPPKYSMWPQNKKQQQWWQKPHPVVALLTTKRGNTQGAILNHGVKKKLYEAVCDVALERIPQVQNPPLQNATGASGAAAAAAAAGGAGGATAAAATAALAAPPQLAAAAAGSSGATAGAIAQQDAVPNPRTLGDATTAASAVFLRMLGANSIAAALAKDHPATVDQILTAAGGVVAALAAKAGRSYGVREHVEFVAQLLHGMTSTQLGKVRCDLL